MSRIRMIVPPFLVSTLCPFDYFFKHSCTRHNSVTVRDIFMQLYRNVNLVRTIITCNNGYFQLLFSAFYPFDFFMLILYPSVNILVRSITQQPFRISSCNFIGICIRLGGCVSHKNDCSFFLSYQVMPL